MEDKKKLIQVDMFTGEELPDLPIASDGFPPQDVETEHPHQAPDMFEQTRRESND